MRVAERFAAGIVLAATSLAGCGGGGDRYLPNFGPAETVVTPTGPVVFTLAPTGGGVFYAELRTNDLFAAARGETPRLIARLAAKPDSLSVDERGQIFVATRTKKHRLAITRFAADQRDSRVIWNGPTSRFAAHIAVTGEGELLVGLAGHLLSLDPRNGPDQKPTVVSSGWTDPVLTLGRGNRIWVADNGLPGLQEHVARGRERDVAKRNRFASALPPYTNPAGVALLDDELLLCSRTHRKVYRLHIGIDDIARRRGWMPGLVCDRDIAAAADRSVVTATTGAIYRYPPR